MAHIGVPYSVEWRMVFVVYSVKIQGEGNSHSLGLKLASLDLDYVNSGSAPLSPHSIYSTLQTHYEIFLVVEGIQYGTKFIG